jgi:2,3-bisphosphoglycerate-independent phosphoglycerate mutase
MRHCDDHESESASAGADAIAALEAAYARGENDEFVQATVIGAPARMRDGDVCEG